MFQLGIVLSIFYLCTLVHSEETIPTCQNTEGINLNLANSGIKHIHKPFVSSSMVSCLNLENNEIQKIESGAFNGLTRLQYLNLARNYLNHELYLNTMNHQSIETLVLDESFIPKDYDMQTRNCYSYERCEERFWINDFVVEMEMPKLNNLYLRRNNISSINRVYLPNITHLYLSHNRISSVDFLKSAPSTLTHIFLDNNKINRFVNKILNTLEELNLDNNSISFLCGKDSFCERGMYLKNAVNLKKLSLSNTSLETIESDAIEDLISLEELNLSHNKIRQISKLTFGNLTNLSSLDLQSNDLFTILDICDLKNLKVLKLNNNRIMSIGDSFSCNISSLEILSLSQNQLNDISPGAFDGLLSLKELDLSGNEFEILPNGWMSAEHNIRFLHLDNNLFTSIASMKLDNCTALESVNIAGNPLITLSLKSLMNLPKNTVIDLNQIYPSKVKKCECDCIKYRLRYGYL